MAKIFPFRPYCYSPAAGPLETLLTQPYDKISPAMQRKYLESSPYNLVRIILGPRSDVDNERDNVYTRAAGHLREWIHAGILAREPEDCLLAYFQDFEDPDSGRKLTRKSFIGLAALEDYSAGVVYRHEQTLSGPKKDRTELLRHTRAHFGQIFMLYPDAEGEVDSILDEAAAGEPLAGVRDEYGALHRVWKITGAERIAAIQARMSSRKLLIADGHHRYETALAYSRENSSPAAQRVMMTFVNMHSPGLRILATHRLLKNLPDFRPAALIENLSRLGRLERFDSAGAFKAAFQAAPEGLIRIGVAFAGGGTLHMLESPRADGALDVPYLHEKILDGVMGIGEEAVREQKHITYVRGIDASLAMLQAGEAQVAFLLQPTGIHDMARIAFSGGVMPQKSTDFYPKLLSGLAIYKLD